MISTKMRCAVFDCDNTDATKMHSFPKQTEAAQEWREALKLREFPIELLQARFGVCSLHFASEDYEDQDGGVESQRKLRENAVPHLRNDTNDQQQMMTTSLAISENGETENIRIMAPTNANIALLQPPSTSKPYRTHSMEFSTASTGGNTDISILKTHDSHYGDDDDTDEDNENDGTCTAQRCREMHTTIDAPDFTVVSCPFEESTEILRFHTIKPSSRNGYSGYSDSDIEVLMSEEINDTEWSAALENLENNALEQRVKTTDCNNEVNVMPHLEYNTPAATISSFQNQESTDRDCSVEELSRQSSLDGLEELSTEQLCVLVRTQKRRIQELESTLTRFRSVQQMFFEHVDAVRQEFAAIDLDKVQANLD